MSNLKQLRNRVKSIKSTQKITKAMNMVAAAKFRKAKDQVASSFHYLDVVSDVMVSIASENNIEDLPEKEQKFFRDRDRPLNKPNLLIVVTSERGLCGSFNSSLIKKVKTDILDLEKNGKEVKLVIIGRKGYDALRGKYTGYIDSYFNFLKGDNNLSLKIMQKIVHMIENELIENCVIYFNKLKNAMVQLPTSQAILPIQKSIKTGLNSYYEYEGENLISQVIRLYINGHINFALLQSRASEEGARMIAMDNATKNANDIIARLTLQLNRSRQAIITKELIEIISGAEVI
jgi:F-type H+-transporting ATPase subunit gamma